MSKKQTLSSQAPKQLNIRLPNGLRRELKARCALEDSTVAGTIEGLVRAYLAGKAKPLKPGK